MKPYTISIHSAGVHKQLGQGWVIPTSRTSIDGQVLNMARMKRAPDSKNVDIELLKQQAMFIIGQVQKWTVQNKGIYFDQMSDFDGFAMPPFELINFLKNVVLYIADAMPINTNKLMVVNPSTFFQLTQNIVRLFLNNDQKKKIKFINKDELREYVDIDNIPIFLNGNWHHPQVEDLESK